jgi:hypothetical protein
MELPNLKQPYTEIEDPNLATDLNERAEPRCEKSRTDNELPVFAKP